MNTFIEPAALPPVPTQTSYLHLIVYWPALSMPGVSGYNRGMVGARYLRLAR